MTNKDPSIFLEHILESVNDIESYSRGISKNSFFEDKQLQDAIIRRVEIIGEAVKNIPDDVKNKYADVSWKEITGTRDIFIHQYFGVDLEIVWNIVKKDLPDLKNKIRDILDDMENDGV
ncbi:MAG: DUF86 domain-containing protein [Candidatus Altiarchaeota archaeon]|nr:DUF86 domain-containing protein [Candidatus Altiarchaeota archaeon]